MNGLFLKQKSTKRTKNRPANKREQKKKKTIKPKKPGTSGRGMPRRPGNDEKISERDPLDRGGWSICGRGGRQVRGAWQKKGQDLEGRAC